MSIDSIGWENASAMLIALTSDTERVIDSGQSAARLHEQKHYLMRHIDSLSIEDRKCVGNILIMNNKTEKLQKCAEGTMIHLDTLPSHIVEQMHSLLTYKINLKTQ